MPHRDWKLRVEHIMDAVRKARAYTRGMTFEEFVSDDRTVDAVLRNFQVIGEAARHVPDEVQARFPDIPRAQMRGMRHVVIHEYAGVSLATVWETVRSDLPDLLPRLEAVLRQ